MVQIKGHRKAKEQRRGEPWPRKFILIHTEGKCPYCHKQTKSLEEHIKIKHKFEKEKAIKGEVHGRD